MITPKDLLILFSYSGETEELLKILPLIKRLGIPIIALTGSPTATLSRAANLHLHIDITQEACPLGLAPTTSTTAMLAMSDALALAVLEARGFTKEAFAYSHPGGRLGKRLFTRIQDLMRQNESIPRVPSSASLAEAIMEITAKQLGFTNVVATHDPATLLGIFTDGDLRRCLGRNLDLHQTRIDQVMTTHFTSVLPEMLATEALALMENLKILSLPVLNEAQQLVGAFNLHDLFRAGIL